MPEKDEGKLCEIKKAVKCSFKYTLPVLTGFIALGMAYGILMQQKGFNALWSLFISATAFCGSMQYVLITMMTAAFDPAGARALSRQKALTQSIFIFRYPCLIICIG